MSEEKIQCLNPVAGKTGKRISKAKYEVLKAEIMSILHDDTPTHTELFARLEKNLAAGKFDGHVSWYGECVKLDLEARHLITRDAAKPPRYHMAQ